MLMIPSFPKKSSFGANGQFRFFEIALQDTGDPTNWGSGKFRGVDFFVGWSESDKKGF